MRIRPFAVSVVAVVMCMAVPASAQDAARTIERYDREVGVKYVAVNEEGSYWGHGVLGEFAFKVCAFGAWRGQVIGEAMVAHFSAFSTGGATYKQGAGGLRFGRLLSPKVRVFGQFQIGAQNDGFEESETAAVFIPGGGFHVALTEMLDLQVLVDAPIAQYSGGTFNQFRMGFGVAVPLGRN